MPDDSAAPGNSSIIVSILDKLKRHPMTLLVVAIGAAVAFAATFKDNVTKLAAQEDAAPVVRVQRFQVKGDAISLMLIGKIDGRLKELLGGRPIVWQNDIYRAAANLHRRFGQPLGGSELRGPLSEAEIKSISSETPLISGAIHQELALKPEQAFALIGKPLESEGWRAAFVEELTPHEIAVGIRKGQLPASTLQFSKLVTCREVLDLLRTTDAAETALYEELDKGPCHAMRFPVTARYLDLSCGAESGTWDVSLTLPQLRMDVLVVQNISDKPIKINKILGLNRDARRVGDGTLLKEDRLIIPTSLLLESPNMDPDASTFVIPLARVLLPEEASERPVSFMVTEFAPADPESAPAPVLDADSAEASSEAEEDAGQAPDAVPSESESAPYDARQAPTIEKTLFTLTPKHILANYGDARDSATTPALIVPEYVVTSLEVNGLDVAVEPIAAGGTYISNAYPVGSCPQLYMTGNDGLRVNLGKILVGRDSEKSKGSNRRHLPAWPAQIILAEHDPETSYVHGITTVCERADGSVHRVPGVRAGSTGPPYPLVLNRGEEASFSFAAPPAPRACDTIYVEVSGYYIPTGRAAP